MQEKTQTKGFDVVHPNVTDANPSVIKQRKDGDKGQKLHPLSGKNTRPLFVTNRAAGENKLNQHQQGEGGHQGCSDALCQPVAQAVPSACCDAFRAVIN